MVNEEQSHFQVTFKQQTSVSDLRAITSARGASDTHSWRPEDSLAEPLRLWGKARRLGVDPFEVRSKPAPATCPALPSRRVFN